MKKAICAAALALSLPLMGHAAPVPKPKPGKPKPNPIQVRLDKSGLGLYQKLLATSILESKLDKAPRQGAGKDAEYKAWETFISGFIIDYMQAAAKNTQAKFAPFEIKYVQKRLKLVKPDPDSSRFRNAIIKEFEAYGKSDRKKFDPSKTPGSLESIAAPGGKPQPDPGTPPGTGVPSEPLSAFEKAVIESVAQDPYYKSIYDSDAALCGAKPAPEQAGCWRGKIPDLFNTYGQSAKPADAFAPIESGYIGKRLAADQSRFQKLLDEASKDKARLASFVAQWRAAIKIEFDGYKDPKPAYAPSELSALLTRLEELNKDPFAVALHDLFLNPVEEAFIDKMLLDQFKDSKSLEDEKKKLIALSQKKSDAPERINQVKAWKAKVFPAVKKFLDGNPKDSDYNTPPFARRGIKQNDVLRYYCPNRPSKGGAALEGPKSALVDLQNMSDRSGKARTAKNPESAVILAGTEPPRNTSDTLCLQWEKDQKPEPQPGPGAGKPTAPPNIGGPTDKNKKEPPAADKNALVNPIFAGKMAAYAGILGLFFGGPAGMMLFSVVGGGLGYAMALDINK